MKANEFIKKLGLGEAKALLAKHEKSFMPRVFDMWSDELQDFVLAEKYASFDMDDLKRLVESHELVQSYKGCGKPRERALSTAKFTLNHLKSTRELEIEIYGNNDREVRLKQAILDVESCQ